MQKIAKKKNKTKKKQNGKLTNVYILFVHMWEVYRQVESFSARNVNNFTILNISRAICLFLFYSDIDARKCYTKKPQDL